MCADVETIVDELKGLLLELPDGDEWQSIDEAVYSLEKFLKAKLMHQED